MEGIIRPPRKILDPALSRVIDDIYERLGSLSQAIPGARAAAVLEKPSPPLITDARGETYMVGSTLYSGIYATVEAPATANPSMFFLRVTTEEGRWSTYTDTDGSFSILNLPVGRLFKLNAAYKDETNATSDWSATLLVYTKGKSGYLYPPLEFSVNRGVGSLFLRWAPNPASQDAHYEVWKHTSDDLANAELLTTTKGNMFLDVEVEDGVEYFYWIRSVDEAGNKSAWFSTAGRSGIPIDVGELVLEPGIIQTYHLADLSVTSIKLAIGAVTEAKTNWQTHLLY